RFIGDIVLQKMEISLFPQTFQAVVLHAHVVGRAEVVQTVNLVAFPQQKVRQTGANEAGSAGEQVACHQSLITFGLFLAMFLSALRASKISWAFSKTRL